MHEGVIMHELLHTFGMIIHTAVNTVDKKVENRVLTLLSSQVSNTNTSDQIEMPT